MSSRRTPSEKAKERQESHRVQTAVVSRTLHSALPKNRIASMHQANEHQRIIAIDLRSSRFGFAVFEGRNRLLDWGIKNFRHGVNAVRIPADVKLGDLMDEFLPNVVVLMEREAETNGRAAMREGLQKEAQKRTIAVHFLSPREVKNAFVGSNCNKYAVAAAVIQRFPELASRRPGPRKIWKPEDYVMKVFDAAALGITYFARYTNPSQQSNVPPHEA